MKLSRSQQSLTVVASLGLLAIYYFASHTMWSLGFIWFWHMMVAGYGRNADILSYGRKGVKQAGIIVTMSTLSSAAIYAAEYLVPSLIHGDILFALLTLTYAVILPSWFFASVAIFVARPGK